MKELYPHGLAWKRKEQPFSTGSGIANSSDVLRSDYIFIDWLSMSQRHFDLLPKINGSVIVKFDEYGLLTYEMLGFKSHLGSFESTINVRCDGDIISISGNPSKYNKLDNLFGLQSLVDCVSLFNSILKEYDLPPLEIGRATISRIDITQNYIVGPNNERDHIRYLSGVNYRNESGYVYPDGNACDWFRHSTRHYLKVYNKTAEFEKHLKKAIKKNALEPQQIDYLNRLINETKKLGVVRVEYEIKSNRLYQLMDDSYDKKAKTLSLNFFNEVSEAEKNSLQNRLLTDPRYSNCKDIVIDIKGSDTKSFELITTAYKDKKQELEDSKRTVSYTHLTLPTIYSV